MDATKKRSATAEMGFEDWSVRKKQKKRIWFSDPTHKTIKPGDAGIFVTCNRKMEARCVGELSPLFEEYVDKLYDSGDTKAAQEDADADIEAIIRSELNDTGDPKDPRLINVKMDEQCLTFFKARPPIDPVALVHKICIDAAQSQERRTRFVKRLTPITLVGHATLEGLQHIARKVLPPYFHKEPVKGKKFAIRPTIRNHSKELTRDGVIQTIANMVGKPHTVDLKGYDLLILVDIFKSICGVAVVGHEYEKLKRYNLAEIYEPTLAVEGSSKSVPKEGS